MDEARKTYEGVPMTHAPVSPHQGNLHLDLSLQRSPVTEKGLVMTEMMTTTGLGTTMTMVVMMSRTGDKGGNQTTRGADSILDFLITS